MSDDSGLRSRRSLITAGLGGFAALLAGAFGRPTNVDAAAGSPIILGSANDAGTSNTTIKTNSSGIALQMNNLGTGVGGFMLSTSGTGLAAQTSHADKHAGSFTNQAGTGGTGAAVLATGKSNHGVVATTTSNGKYAVKATGANGTAIYATAIQEGVYAEGYRAVHGKTTDSGVSAGVYGENTGTFDTYGVYGRATGTSNARGVFGEASGATGTAFGVYGSSASTSFSGAGVRGVAGGAGGNGLYGSATATTGQSFGLWAETADATGLGAYIANNAGGTGLSVFGDTDILGALSKSSGTFKIDHPLDPANKYLFHSFVESPDMMNVYNGNATLDGTGEATIALPDWFEALNRDFRYQLTAIGRAAPDLHVKSGVKKNRFVIAGGGAGQEISWQVTGIRQDAYAKAHPIEVEVAKAGKEKGRYLHPKEHGKPASKGMAAQHGKG